MLAFAFLKNERSCFVVYGRLGMCIVQCDPIHAEEYCAQGQHLEPKSHSVLLATSWGVIARAVSRVLEAPLPSCRRCRRTTKEQPSTTGCCLYRDQADPGQGPCDRVSPTKVLSCPSTIHPARRRGCEQKDAWTLSVSATVARRVN